jgi:hypothetical protein
MAERLGRCRAYLVGRTGTQTASLVQIAQRTGFGEISTLDASGDYPSGDPRHLNFFIVHRHLNSTMMTAVIRSIRLSEDDQIRFAPVILFADDGPLEPYLNYVYMGFDDIITLPDKQPVLVQRLNRQLGTEQTYFETRDYFGPDRRRMEAPYEIDLRGAPDPHSHSRYVFSRVPGAGVQISRTEISGRPELAHAALLRGPLPGPSALR